jgi:CheY-like chemotaxis protein
VVRIEVADTGIGITDEQLPRLFAVFEQADQSTTRRFGGTGLGLAICRELAQLMSGVINVDSVPGRGAAFTLSIPLSRLGHESAPLPAPPAGDEVELLPLRVLAAEDNAVNQLVLRTLLNQLGLDPHVVEDGAAAVAAWESMDWDVILMDVQMPVMDGLDATRAIRLLPQGAALPILAMTANAFDEERQRCLDAGMDDHVAKPVVAEQLFATLHDWLSGAKKTAPRPEGQRSA